MAELGYSWEQSDADVRLTVPLADSVKAKDVVYKLTHRGELTLGLKGAVALIDEPLWGRCSVEDSLFEIESIAGKRTLVTTLVKAPAGRWDYLLRSQDVPPDLTPTSRVWMDISIGSEAVGRMTFGLYGHVTPKTCENFRALCTGEKGDGLAGKPLHYKGSTFHRVIPGFMIQGGDFTAGNGTGGESIYGAKFEDENFRVKHTKAGLLSMANAGAGTNGSQFFVTLASTPHLDGKHVVFGELLEGKAIMKQIEAVGSNSGTTSRAVEVVDCGEL